MENKSSVLILCAFTRDARQLKRALDCDWIEAEVCASVGDTLTKMRDRPYDMLVTESVIGKASGLALLAETRKHLPNMLRVLVETAPLEAPLYQLINDVAPSAIFKDHAEVEQLQDLLRDKRKAEQMQPDATQGAAAPDSPPPPVLDHRSTQMLSKMEEIIQEPDLTLPALPEVAMQVRDLLADENCSFEKVARLVEVEQALSARLLQVANSPIYAGLERIRNLTDAVARLGLRETQNILMAVVVQNLFRSKNKEREKLVKALWQHSLAVGYSNEMIAQELSIPESKNFFMMGLLHDVGKLLIMHMFEIGLEKEYWQEKELTAKVVADMLHMRHNAYGARLLDRWEYPAAFQRVVLLHNESQGLAEQEEAVIVTYFSNLLSRKLGYSLLPYEGDPLSDRELARALNLSTPMREKFQEKMKQTTDRIRRSCFSD